MQLGPITNQGDSIQFVTPVLDMGIHVSIGRMTWAAGSSPAMTL